MRRRGKASARVCGSSGNSSELTDGTRPIRTVPSPPASTICCISEKAACATLRIRWAWGKIAAQFSQSDRRSGTVDQLTAEYRFNLPQGAAQRRLANRQPTGGIGKMAQLGQGDEILKLFKRERGQPLPGFVHHRVRYGGPAQ